MQTPRSTPKKSPKFMDTKVLIAASSIAVTIGMWNLFSNGALNDQIASQKTVQAAPAEAPVAAGQGLPPMPTLVPLVDVTSLHTGQLTTAQDSGPLAASEIQPNKLNLRSVTAPDQVIVQKVKPMFDQPGIVVIGGGSSGNKGPAAKARSSH